MSFTQQVTHRHPPAAPPPSPPCADLKVSPIPRPPLFLFYTQGSLKSSFACCRWLLDRLQVEKDASSVQLMWIHCCRAAQGSGFCFLKVKVEIQPRSFCSFPYIMKKAQPASRVSISPCVLLSPCCVSGYSGITRSPVWSILLKWCDSSVTPCMSKALKC